MWNDANIFYLFIVPPPVIETEVRSPSTTNSLNFFLFILIFYFYILFLYFISISYICSSFCQVSQKVKFAHRQRPTHWNTWNKIVSQQRSTILQLRMKSTSCVGTFDIPFPKRDAAIGGLLIEGLLRNSPYLWKCKAEISQVGHLEST